MHNAPGKPNAFSPPSQFRFHPGSCPFSLELCRFLVLLSLPSHDPRGTVLFVTVQVGLPTT